MGLPNTQLWSGIWEQKHSRVLCWIHHLLTHSRLSFTYTGSPLAPLPPTSHHTLLALAHASSCILASCSLVSAVPPDVHTHSNFSSAALTYSGSVALEERQWSSEMLDLFLVALMLFWDVLKKNLGPCSNLTLFLLNSVSAESKGPVISSSVWTVVCWPYNMWINASS